MEVAAQLVGHQFSLEVFHEIGPGTLDNTLSERVQIATS